MHRIDDTIGDNKIYNEAISLEKSLAIDLNWTKREPTKIEGVDAPVLWERPCPQFGRLMRNLFMPLFGRIINAFFTIASKLVVLGPKLCNKTAISLWT